MPKGIGYKKAKRPSRVAVRGRGRVKAPLRRKI